MHRGTGVDASVIASSSMPEPYRVTGPTEYPDGQGYDPHSRLSTLGDTEGVTTAARPASGRPVAGLDAQQ
jgi:hypothetical protein